MKRTLTFLAASLLCACQSSPYDGQLIASTSDPVTFAAIGPQGYWATWFVGFRGDPALTQCQMNTFYVTDSSGDSWYTCSVSKTVPLYEWAPLANASNPPIGPPSGANYMTMVGGVYTPDPSGTVSQSTVSGSLRDFNAAGGLCAYDEYQKGMAGTQIMTNCSLPGLHPGESPGVRLFAQTTPPPR